MKTKMSLILKIQILRGDFPVIRHLDLARRTYTVVFLMLFAQLDVFGLARTTHIPDKTSDWERYTSVKLFGCGRLEVQIIKKCW